MGDVDPYSGRVLALFRELQDLLYARPFDVSDHLWCCVGVKLPTCDRDRAWPVHSDTPGHRVPFLEPRFHRRLPPSD